MINFALLGTGRIGKLHASIINAHPEASLKYVYDRDEKFEVISNDINKVKEYVINSI